jgi:protein TonB
MTEGSFYQPKSKSPTALTVVVLMHGAAIAALAMHKMEVMPTIFEPTTIIDIKDPPPPPDIPPEPMKKVEPTHRSVVTIPPRIIDPPIQRPVYDMTPVPPMPIPYTPPAPVDIEPTPPPPPPPPAPKKLEPARAKANLASYVSDADYPASAQRNEEQGTTRFRLAVGPDGRVADCTVTGSSGSSALDSTTCRLMRSRARFTPARDSAGNKTSDTVSSAIKWVLPAE